MGDGAMMLYAFENCLTVLLEFDDDVELHSLSRPSSFTSAIILIVMGGLIVLRPPFILSNFDKEASQISWHGWQQFHRPAPVRPRTSTHPLHRSHNRAVLGLYSWLQLHTPVLGPPLSVTRQLLKPPRHE